MQEKKYIAKTLKGLEPVLAQELTELGANEIEIQRRAVSFSGDQRILYKANLHLRTALRVLVPIATFEVKTTDEVYDAVKSMDWSQYMTVKTTFSIDSVVNSEVFNHSKFISYRAKDAIVDWFTENQASRPSVKLDNPDLYINIHISHSTLTVSLDSSGESLHKRGYRIGQNEAPISEVLAAGMLLTAGWKGQCNFVDPFCGSGTLLIEAALIALNIPPGIFRQKFAFERWTDFNKELFDELFNDDSCERDFNYKIYGSDISKRNTLICEDNIKSAGLSKHIVLTKADVADFQPIEGQTLMVTNPPYGERMVSENLYELYSTLGSVLKHRFTNNTAWVISSHLDCLHKIGMKPSDKIDLLNSNLECFFWKFDIFSGKKVEYRSEGGAQSDRSKNEENSSEVNSGEENSADENSTQPREENSEERPERTFSKPWENRSGDRPTERRYGNSGGARSGDRPERRFSKPWEDRNGDKPAERRYGSSSDSRTGDRPERRFSKPWEDRNGDKPAERRYGSSSDSRTGDRPERRFSKPWEDRNGDKPAERRYGSSSDSRTGDRPERRFSKPWEDRNGDKPAERRYGSSSDSRTGDRPERRFSKPWEDRNGDKPTERRYGNSSDSRTGDRPERRFSKPWEDRNGDKPAERRYGSSSDSRTGDRPERKFSKPWEDRNGDKSAERRYGSSSDSRTGDRPERKFSKPWEDRSGSRPSERRYGKPSDGRSSDRKSGDRPPRRD